MQICSECAQTYDDDRLTACAADGTPLEPADDPMLGTTIGSYRVAKLMGAGGMGRVYKGVHPGIGSRVAIKILSGEFTQDRELVDRFFAEARAVNLIRHEGIVNIVDLSKLGDGRPYIVMEYLDGEPMSTLLRRQTVPLGDLCAYTLQILDALGAAHAKGIIHRDLKPDNIFVSPSGRVKVLDFGIAKLTGGLDAKPGPTRTGSLLGTPFYMSPEQCLGQAIDGRADLYALGVILYEAATGHVPFKAEVLFELLRMQISDAPVPPRKQRPELPVALEKLILRALAKEPAARFSSAADMGAQLTELAHSLPPDVYSARMTGGFGALSPRPTPHGAGQLISGGGVQTPISFQQTAGALPQPTVKRQRRGYAWAALGGGVVLLAGVVALALTLRKTEREDKAKPAPPLAAGDSAGPRPLPGTPSGLPKAVASPGASLGNQPSVPPIGPAPTPNPTPSPTTSLPPPPSPLPPTAPPVVKGATPRKPKTVAVAAPVPAAVPAPVPVAVPQGGNPQPAAAGSFVWKPEYGQILQSYTKQLQSEQFVEADASLALLPDDFPNKKELVRSIRLVKNGAIETRKRMLPVNLQKGRCDVLEGDIAFLKKFSPDDVAAAEDTLKKCKEMSPADLKEKHKQEVDEIVKNARWYFPSGNGRSALEEIKKALPIAPNDQDVIEVIVEAHCLEQEADEAKAAFKRLAPSRRDAVKDFCAKKGPVAL